MKKHGYDVVKTDKRFENAVNLERKTDAEWGQLLLSIKAKNLKKGSKPVGDKPALKPKAHKKESKPTESTL